MDIEMPVSFNYTSIPAATSSLVKSGGGFLHTVVVSNASATTGTMSLYDNASATGTTPLIATVAASIPGVYTFDIKFANGLAIANTSSPSALVTFV